MTLCITNPIWVTKTRLVLQYDAGVDPSKRQYRGMFDALIKIYKTEGIRGLYKVRQFKKKLQDWLAPLNSIVRFANACLQKKNQHTTCMSFFLY